MSGTTESLVATHAMSGIYGALRRTAKTARPNAAAQAATESRVRTRLGMLAIATATITVLGIIGWVIASSFFGLGAFVLTTGSMSPAIPLGSLALVQSVSAADVAVGDIVTVPRTVNAPPVTQRVIAVASTSHGYSELTIRGDAYEGAGVAYGVKSVDRVVATIPYVGEWLRTMLRPVVLAPLTALIVIASMWVLWPETTEKKRRHGSHAAAHR